MDKILINTHKYDGQYIALKSADDNTIVGSGNTPQEALNEAKANGIEAPILSYVPDKELIQIYYVG